MRGAFGLVSLLIGGLIIAYLWADHTKTVANVNKTIQPQIRQLAGKNPDGTPAIKSATFKELPGSGPIKGVQIVTIDPTGGLAVYWGLQPNDIIRGIGPFVVGDNTLTDLETVREWTVEGMQRSYTMAVDRAGANITLPAGGAPPSSPVLIPPSNP